jgi:protein transport protein SEC20
MSLYFKTLDEIQNAVYENLTLLLHTEAPSEKTKLLTVINHSLINYKQYVLVLRSKLSTQPSQLATLDVYEDKLIFLKEKVRDYQLKSHDSDNVHIHQQRIDKYKPVDHHHVESELSQRDQLFAGRSEKIVPELSVNQQILQHNKKITSSLQATRQLMSTSILQTELNIDSLDQQSKDLSTLNEQYASFNDVLLKSKQLISFIEKQDKKDKRRIYMSLGFFLLVCAWIIWKRILRGPVRLMLWSFFKVFGIFSFVFGPSNPVPSLVKSVTSVAVAPLPTVSASTTGIVTSDAVETVSLDVASTVTQAISSILELASSAISEIEMESISTIIIESSERLMDEL